MIKESNIRIYDDTGRNEDIILTHILYEDLDLIVASDGLAAACTVKVMINKTDRTCHGIYTKDTRYTFPSFYYMDSK